MLAGSQRAFSQTHALSPLSTKGAHVQPVTVTSAFSLCPICCRVWKKRSISPRVGDRPCQALLWRLHTRPMPGATCSDKSKGRISPEVEDGEIVVAEMPPRTRQTRRTTQTRASWLRSWTRMRAPRSSTRFRRFQIVL